jgi:hypothetical protein
MEITVAELIKKLQEYNPDATVVSITVGTKRMGVYVQSEAKQH